MWIFFTELLNYIFFQNYDGFLEGTLIRLSHLNILYVKVFQALSFSKEMISEELNNKMIRYTDNVPWGNEDIDQELLDKVKKKYNITFRGGYDFPIRSGMISLIYKGVRQGKDVILKMKRKDIANRLEEAVDNLLFVIYLFSFIPNYDFDIPKIIRENTEMILNQTDFIEEMKNTKLIRKNCEHLKYVKIPEVYEEVTEEFNDVILMNFIDGERIDKIKVGEYESYAKQVVKFGLTTLLIHGVVHGDLHSGNIIFIKDDNDKKYPYKIGVIDFGIIMRIGCEYKNELIDVITNYLTETGEATIDKVFRSSMIQPKGIVDKIDPLEYKSLLKICGNAVDNAKSNKITVDCNALFETMKDAMKLVNTDKYKELGITFSPDYLKTQMIMAMTNGLTMTLCKNTYNVVLEAALNELFHLDIFMDVDE
jgi:predicted unusual protein kinase regulating ubiquinone biosynthesis (AarF/ABC1/UbiB family)